MHDEEQAAHAAAVEQPRHFDRPLDVAMDVELEMAEQRVGHRGGLGIGLVIGLIALGEFVDRQQGDARVLDGAHGRRRNRAG